MSAKKLSDADFTNEYHELGAHKLAKKHGFNVRTVFRRRKRLEEKNGLSIKGPRNLTQRPKEYPQRAQLTVLNGHVLIGSDAHYWPGPPSLMHRAFVECCREFKPQAVILNGDVIDAPQISRHAPIGWEHRPKLADEIEAAKERCHEIEKVAGRVERVWNLGNHDARFETRLATVAPEYAKIHGVHLSDHFPLWKPAWSTWINNSVVAKHRFKSGIHAPHNNTMWAGITIITGHLHSAKVMPFTDYNGTRYGVDTGCIADTDHEAFTDYSEDNPKNWRSAFCLLTFVDGKLMMPELVTKWDDESVQFRGEVFIP